MGNNIFLHKDEQFNGVPRILEGENSRITNDSGVIDELNVYRNWGQFGVIPEFYEEKDEKGNQKSVQWVDPYNNDKFKNTIGTKSLFNPVNAVRMTTVMQVENNAPLIDTPELRKRIKQRGDCSVKELVRASSNNEMGRAIYNYSDFMYCKHLGRVSNNYLITLRRFPFPCGDHINFTMRDNETEKRFNEHMPDVGRLVTWMGTPGNEMSNILKYSVKMPWEEVEAHFENVDGSAEKGGLIGGLMNLSSTRYANNAIAGIGGNGPIGAISSSMKYVGGAIGGVRGLGWVGKGVSTWGDKLTTPPDDYERAAHYYDDRTKVYGNADVISKTHKRRDADKGGLEFNQEFSLTFDYELRSYDGINGRAAFLDLIANILAVTYTNGKFWGGEYRGSGQSQLNAFTNLPIYNMLSPNSSEPFTFSNLINSTIDSVNQIGKQFSRRADGSEGNLLDAIKNIASNIGKSLLGGTLNALGRPHKQALNSLLSPAPVGLWHVTIGNPKHPIMSMGNMILEGTDIEHYGPLGFDDFPTGIKVTIKLKHAKPRDAAGIENMYYMGDYRIYQPMGKYIKYMYEAASPYKDKEDNYKGDQTKMSKVNGEVKDINEEKTLVQDVQKKYMKYFGTHSNQNIEWAAMEGHQGSQKVQSEEEAKKIQNEVKNSVKK